MTSEQNSCGICGHTVLERIYQGPIRAGKFGSFSTNDESVYRCAKCGVGHLAGALEDAKTYYEGSRYREEVNVSSTAADYYRQHDAEQARNLGLTGAARFRGKVVADVGCGGGSFLDAVAGYASQAIAIEPSTEYQEELRRKGYATFSYADEANGIYARSVDVAVSFSVIEHIEEPVPFLRSIRSLLKPGGVCLLTTPNLGDCLLMIGPANYPSFYFRKVHRWYFDRLSLETAFLEAGFSACEVLGHHRFGLANAFGWLREQKPAGNAPDGLVTSAMDAVWKAELERTFACDYLYAVATA